MEFDAALKEFADLLSIGSTALKGLVMQADQSHDGTASALFHEVDGLADRLLCIADQISKDEKHIPS